LQILVFMWRMNMPRARHVDPRARGQDSGMKESQN
jgi:hypothetical protein